MFSKKTLQKAEFFGVATGENKQKSAFLRRANAFDYIYCVVSNRFVNANVTSQKNQNKKVLLHSKTFLLELLARIELATTTLPRWCSTTEPHQHKYLLLDYKSEFIVCQVEFYLKINKAFSLLLKAFILFFLFLNIALPAV